MRRILSLVVFLLAISPAFAGTGTLVPNGQQQFNDSNGAPYAGGSVCFYIPGTTTPSLTWQDQNLTVANTSPCVTLNSAGRAIVWGSGTYRQVLYDLNGVLVWDQVVSAGFPSGLTLNNVTLTGTVTVPNGSIAILGLAPIPSMTFLGNNLGTSGPVTALTPGQIGTALCREQIATFGSGSGTFSTPLCNGILPNQLHIRAEGGGGGGGGSGAGASGTDTTFSGGATSIDAGGGGGGNPPASGSGGGGGPASGGTINLQGGSGAATAGSVTGSSVAGGQGGSGPFGGGGTENSTGNANTGGGGGGLGNTTEGSGGGGAGGYVEAWLTPTLAGSYTYSVGTGGAAGSGGSGTGGSGILIIEATWQ